MIYALGSQGILSKLTVNCLPNRIRFSWRYLEGGRRTQKRCMGFRLERHKSLPGAYGTSVKFVNDMKSYLVERYGETSKKTWSSLRYWRNVKLISVVATEKCMQSMVGKRPEKILNRNFDIHQNHLANLLRKILGEVQEIWFSVAVICRFNTLYL